MSFRRKFKDIDRDKLIKIKSRSAFPKTDIQFLSAYGYIMSKQMYNELWQYLGSELILIRYKTVDPLNPDQYIIW